MIQLSIDGWPWVNVASFPSAPPQTATWSYKWLVNEQTYGTHSLRVRAVDVLGQIGDATEISVVVDTLAPALTCGRHRPHLQANHTFSLLGHADDEGNVPLPARPYELANAMDSLISATVMLMRNHSRRRWG